MKIRRFPQSTPRPLTILTTNCNFISDDSITQAVEVLRTYIGQHKIFIANGLANITLSSWNSTQGWQHFGRIFNSREAAFTKPYGCYLIPIYAATHWHFVAVTKRNRFFEGWILDSLGVGRTDTTIRISIKTAFSLYRGRWLWRTSWSFRQVENECGPRILQGIWEICKGIRDGVRMETCIEKTSMKDNTTSTYNPNQIRKNIANLMRTYTAQTNFRRITFVSSSNGAKAGRGTKRKRSKQIRKKTIVIDAEW